MIFKSIDTLIPRSTSRYHIYRIAMWNIDDIIKTSCSFFALTCGVGLRVILIRTRVQLPTRLVSGFQVGLRVPGVAVGFYNLNLRTGKVIPGDIMVFICSTDFRQQFSSLNIYIQDIDKLRYQTMHSLMVMMKMIIIKIIIKYKLNLWLTAPKGATPVN